MPEQAKVDDLEVFRQFRAALLKFGQMANQALISADSQVARTLSWLEGEQTAFWQGQLRKRTEAVARAREAVRQKKLFKDSAGRTPNAAQEEKTLAQCLAAVEEAEHKITAVRKAIPRLEKEAEVYRGSVARLAGTLIVEIPQAVALLDRLAGSMEQYVSLEAPAMAMPEPAAMPATDESMSRGQAVEMPPAPVQAEAAKNSNAAAPPAAAPADRKE